MKILMFSWRGPGHPHAGGAELATHEHAKAWMKAGHTVTLFTSHYDAAPAEETVEGVRVIRRGSQAFGVKIEAFKWYLFENKEKYDLVIDHFHGIPFFTPLFVRLPKIAFIHEVAREVWRLNTWRKPFNLLPSIIGRLGEPLVFLLYRSIPFITVSDSTKNDLLNFGIPSRNIHVVENGVTVLRSSKVRQKRFTLMFLGALAKDKGIEDALLAFAITKKSIPNISFWIVGKGLPDYIRFLKRKAQDLNILPNTVFYGFVSEKKKFDLLAQAHILVNPSFHEGWGLVNIEANSLGVPVVGYNVAGTRDSVIHRKTGLLVNKSDTDALAKQIIALTKNKKLWQTLSQQAKTRASRYTWLQAGNRSLSLIEKYA